MLKCMIISSRAWTTRHAPVSSPPFLCVISRWLATQIVIFHPDLISKGLPRAAVITLQKLAPDSGFIYSFKCKIASFVLFRAFNITLEFGPEETKNFHIHSDPNPHENLEKEGMYKISGASTDTSDTLYVWVNVSSDRLTSVTCSAHFTHNTSSVSKRIEVQTIHGPGKALCG